MTYFYGSMRRIISGIESTIGTPPTVGFQDWCTSFAYAATRQTQNIEEYSGGTNGITDIVELNHYWKLTFSQYLRFQGLGINSLACILGGGDTMTGVSSPYNHYLALAQASNLVKTKSLWLDDGSGSVQLFPAATVESWKLDWDTSSDANKVEVVLDSFSPIGPSSGQYVAPPSYPNLTSVNSQSAGRAGRAVDVQYQVYNGSGAAWTSTPERGSITLSRPTSPFFGQSFGSAGASGVSPFTKPSELLAANLGADPLNPVAFVSGPLAVSGEFDAVFDGSQTGKPYSDYINFRELIGSVSSTNAPTGAPTVTESGSGTGPAVGTYKYGVSFLTPRGETAIGPVASYTSASGHAVNLSNLPTGNTGTAGIIGRRIYRSKVGTTTPLFLVATLMDPNNTTTYTDTTLDSALSTAQPPTDSSSAKWTPLHRLVFYDQALAYYVELDLGPMRIDNVNVDGSQHPIRITLPFTAYSDLSAMTIGNDGVAWNNIAAAIVSSPYSSKIF
jgi:hypothetical protein